MRGLALLSDTARFRGDDPDELVAATFACPVCLHGEGIERLEMLCGYDPSVDCRCESCDTRWRVYVTPDQALRLSVLHH